MQSCLVKFITFIQGWGDTTVLDAALRQMFRTIKLIVAVKSVTMIPGEIIVQPGEIVLNAAHQAIKLQVANTGDRPIQIGSHFHFYEANAALDFDRARSRGMRLDIPAGTAVRFEPGDEKQVNLIPLAGSRQVYGFNGEINGNL